MLPEHEHKATFLLAILFNTYWGGGGGRHQEKAHASEEGEQKGAVEDDQGET